MLSPVTIENVQNLAIEDVISKYTELKKAGHNYKTSCPLPTHKENTPSFVVSPHKNIFKCFGCGAGGDAIEFVMQMENVPFIEACKSIAQQHGIQIEESDVKGKTEEQKQDEQVMLQLMHQAQLKYTNILNAAD
jgi:DNA primase